jgi:hypothetical protein
MFVTPTLCGSTVDTAFRGDECCVSGQPASGSGENGLMAGVVAGYGRRVGIFTVMVRRARLRAVAPGVGLAPAR